MQDKTYFIYIITKAGRTDVTASNTPYSWGLNLSAVAYFLWVNNTQTHHVCVYS